MSFFLVPIETVVSRGLNIRQPKYIPALGVKWAQVDFRDTSIVWAAASGAQEASVGANSDVLVVPALDNTVALVATRSALEARDVPGNWVQAGMTYRSVLRVLIGMAQLIQRMQGMGVNPVISGHLNDQINSFSGAIQTALANAVDSMGLSRANISGTTTLRAALLDIGQQFVAGSAISLGDL